MLVVFFLLRSCNACKRNENIALTVNRKKIKSRVLSSRPQNFTRFCRSFLDVLQVSLLLFFNKY